ncbi:hypothetical protein GCM10009434_08790 [Brevundimonas olei]
MVKRALNYIAAGVGLLAALVFGLGIFANTIAGLVGLVAAIPVYAVSLGAALGGPALMLWLFFRDRPRP